jgi:hypothetical protein
MSKLQKGIVQSISPAGKNKGPEKVPLTEGHDAFEEAGVATSEFRDAGPKQSGGELQNFDLDFPVPESREAVGSEGDTGVEPEPIPVKAKNSKKKASKTPGGGGKLLGGSALVVSLLALSVAGVVGFKQLDSDSQIRQTVFGLQESISDLVTQDGEITQSLAQTQSAVSENTARISDIEQFRSDLATMSTVLDSIQNELSGIKTTLGDHREILDEHRLDIDVVSKEVKTLSERPARTVVKTVPAPAPQPVAEVQTLEGATVASIDMWGVEPYVVLQDASGGWVPLKVGDYYRGWKLQGAVNGEAVFKAGSKVRRLSVEG